MTVHVAIDRRTMEIVGVGGYRALNVLADIQGRDSVTVAYADQNKTYSAFGDAQLRMLYKNITGLPFTATSYFALLQAVHALVMTLPRLAQTEEELEIVATKKLGALPRPAKVKISAERLITKRDKPVQSVRSGTVFQRPGATTSTGKVWDICDSLFPTEKDKKRLKLLVLSAGREAGINDSTISVQFGKWWVSVGSPLDQQTV